MLDFLYNKDEKKVEYIELIYDLIFVYLIGKNNALLHTVSDGFFTANTYLTYTISTLVILQIWYFSTLFINRYGENSVSDHIGLFINMYLLYYLANSTSTAWFGYYAHYNAAWGLILLNLALQYGLRLRKSRRTAPWETQHLRCHMVLLLIQAAIVLASIPLYAATRVPLSGLSLLFGFLAGFFTEKVDRVMPINFEHLSERVMLYIVFTFGEMIVSIADYFEGGLNLNTFYFSLMGFLIVAGLLISYGFLYNRVIDRQMSTSGNVYMLIHIVLVTALSNITVALEFMREPEIRTIAKNVFLVASFLAYYIFLFFIGHFAKNGYRAGWGFFANLLAVSAAFVGLMMLFYENGLVSIAVSVLFVYAVFGMIVLRWRKVKRAAQTQ